MGGTVLHPHIEKMILRFRQKAEAGFPEWERLQGVLQLRLRTERGEVLLRFDPEAASAIVVDAELSARFPLAVMQEEALLSILSGKRNLQQAYLNDELAIFGRLPDALFFTQFFFLCIQTFQEEFASHDSSYSH